MHDDSMRLAEKILKAVSRYRKRHFREPGTIRLSVFDARCLDELSKQQGDFVPISRIQAGDTATLWGRPCAVSGRLSPGVAYLGRTRISLP